MQAGFDTTAITLSWVVYEMMLNPDCQEKLRSEIEESIGKGTVDYDNVFKLKYLDMCVNETLRMHPPAGRFAPENKHNINEYAFVPFGVGPRNCIGQRLALLEVKMTIVKLLQNFRFHRTDKLEVPMPMSKSGLLKPGKPIFVIVEKL